MDYNILLDLVTDLGYELAMCGAETFRVEESINLILSSYGIQSEAFAIPNCLHVSIVTDLGVPMTRMRRIGHHGNDLDAVERYSALSRRICSEIPSPEIAQQWLRDVTSSRIHYSQATNYIGHFIGSMGFAILFGGTFIDSICAGICGLIVGFVDDFTGKLKANQFFRTIIASFLLALPAYGMGALGIAHNPDAVIIGALMLLVPGLLFTNAMRDIIYGDTNSGTNRVVQVFLVAAAIALGTAVAWNLSSALWGGHIAVPDAGYPFWVHAIACFVGCMGFSIIINIHGPGGLLFALGGVLSWSVYSLLLETGTGDIGAYFFAAVFSAAYSEKMARVRKCPAIAYLVVSIFPLIPGAGVYYTMTHAVRGDMASFANQGTHTIAIAGIMAVGILMVSTSVRVIRVWRQRKMQ